MSGPPTDTLLEKLPAETEVHPLAFADLKGWAEDDHAGAFAALLETCAPVLDGLSALRDALPPPPGLIQACRAARHLATGGAVTATTARVFFEQYFTLLDIRPKGSAGFLTAYYEPEIEASLIRTAGFPIPVLGRPADLVTLKQGETRSGIPEGYQAGRQTADGLVVYPDRAAIWAGALAGQGLEIAWLRDEAELFITQVQGSARLRLPDGRKTRLVYAGRNGHPYTSIGKKIVERGEMRLEDMTLAKLMAWLRADPARGRALMEENRSYVFFARDDIAPQDRGPIGGAGVPLTEGRSLAVDRTIWPYGLPVFIEVEPLTPEGPRRTIRRLMIAQDTGSAIVGAARGDYFMGSGEEAGARAGLVRDAMRFVILKPRIP
ncbi:MAG: lytic murein transglycosylase [Rhizobiales bacterium PAR1]|nr:MAG: lytic murein transglycosylase [Rhizobiales bacterium PAR1]